MRLFLLLLLIFPCVFFAPSTFAPKKFHCLSGTPEISEEIRCKESQGCQTEIIPSNDGSEEYKMILGCNERLKCGNVQTKTGFVVCCMTSVCNRGFKYLEDDLTAKEAAEALAVQADKWNTLPQELPKPVVNPVDEETEEESATDDPQESGRSGGLIGYLFLWIIVIRV